MMMLAAVDAPRDSQHALRSEQKPCLLQLNHPPPKKHQQCKICVEFWANTREKKETEKSCLSSFRSSPSPLVLLLLLSLFLLLSSSFTACMSSILPRRQLTTVENGLVGGVSGTLEVLIQQPTVAWKNALQEKRPFSVNPLFLYRGVGINASSIAPITAVQFAVNGALTGLIKHDDVRDWHRLAIAATAGAASALVSTPAEIIMIQQQKSGKSVRDGRGRWR